MNKLWSFVGRIAFWLSWPGLYFYLRRGQRARVIILSGEKILVVKGFLGKSDWMLPGGGVHSGESMTQGAAREVLEETGISVKPSDLKKVGEGVANEYGLKFDYQTFLVKIPQTSKIRIQKWELVDAAWLDMQEILQRTDISPETRRILSSWSAHS